MDQRMVALLERIVRDGGLLSVPDLNEAYALLIAHRGCALSDNHYAIEAHSECSATAGKKGTESPLDKF